MPETPEQLARQKIDAQLVACGWLVQEKSAVNLSAGSGVAVCELAFKIGVPDYTLFVDGKAIGTVEAKPEGHSLVGVEEQSSKYVAGVPSDLPAWRTPLPFSQESTVAEVGRWLSVVKKSEAVVSANLQRATRLRQAVLQRAFSGRL